ncbi:MAG: molecular chaperone DnaJ [Nanoarchaeota archaeon]
MAKDYYKTLGVNKSASKEDIKKSYKELAKKFHPDLNKSPDAEARFKEISEAFSVLSDDQKRGQYDQFGSDAFKYSTQGGGPDFSGFNYRDFGNFHFDSDINFDDIFESFFGPSFSGSSGRRSRQQRGADLQYNLEITLEDAAFGTKKIIEFKKNSACTECNGRGGEGITTCDKCNGSGVLRETARTPFGIFQTQTSCRHCNGTGQKIKNVCRECRGAGIVKSQKKIEVKIPAGVDEGNHLRIEGEGEAGRNNSQPGNLYVAIHIRNHEYFQRVRNDISIDVPVSFVQAALGDEIIVPTLKGEAKLRIPKGTQSGTVFKMAGKGLPSLNSYRIGDQNVRVYVEVPEKLTRQQQELLADFAAASGEEARPQEGFFEKIKRKFSP